jgi:hypothetical protein
MLALGLTALVLMILWRGVSMPLIELHGDRAEMLAQRGALAHRMAALVDALPAFQKQLAMAATGGTDGLALLEGDSGSVAGAELQDRLQTMFMQAGVQLNSVETVPGEEAGAYRRIRLRVSFNATWPVLMDLLKQMHVATLVLLVDDLQVQPALHRISTAPGTFDVSCSVFAFRSGAVRAAAR